MESILAWNTKEGMIFRGGSGSGINLSKIRSSKEQLSKGGLASGPVSFMRGADAWAGTIKSGGKTRRAAKMVVLDVDHPDIREFIWCKAREEDKAAALREAGFDMSIDGEGFHSIQYQNANNSVRVTSDFLDAVERGEEWHTTARLTGEPVETFDARALMDEIAEAAWRCADPGIQYDTTINDWHTCPNTGRINASNPCSEYMHVDDSACNLASINLMKFLGEDGGFDTAGFEHAVDIMFLAQEIMVGFSSYPTEEITANAKAMRQLGLGYANLGALLMARGLPYDSDEGRSVAAAITALMTGRAYRTSGEVAAAIGPYDEFEKNRDPHLGVMRMHRDAAHELEEAADTELLAAARRSWDEAVTLGERHGHRNAQATVLAPTGTISFLMDCDTTGIEPDFSLVKMKELVGGGNMTIVNRTVPRALRTLGYSPAEVERIEAYVNDHRTIVGAPGLKDEHLPVFDVAVGQRAISHMGHIKMMSAVQPFISGAISKTVNMPADSTVADIREAYVEGGRLGLKALAIYRDGSKTAQALRTDAGQKQSKAAKAEAEEPAPSTEPPAARARVAHAQVLDRRPRGLHHRRQVRGRLAGRDLPHRHRQGRLHAARHDERVRDRDLDRAPVRSAARDLRAQVQLHALRPGGHDDEPGDPVREEPARLHHAVARVPLPGPVGARGARHHELGRAREEDGRGNGPGDVRQRRQRPRQRPLERPRRRRVRRRRVPGPHGRPHRLTAGGPGKDRGPGPGPSVLAVRRHDAADGVLLHLFFLRQQHRLRVAREGCYRRPSSRRRRGLRATFVGLGSPRLGVVQ